MDEVWNCINAGEIYFSRLDMIFSKLLRKNFNIVVREKDADDITITITPHHEKKYGRDILNRINIIIQEIDFWYPPNEKQLLFQSIAKTTEKIQEPLQYELVMAAFHYPSRLVKKAQNTKCTSIFPLKELSDYKRFLIKSSL